MLSKYYDASLFRPKRLELDLMYGEGYFRVANDKNSENVEWFDAIPLYIILSNW